MFNNQEKNKIHCSEHRRNSGQTLIETLAAVFILTMGVTASVGLAIYALNTSGGIVKQIIATGLAREGLEAVRNMRDTNWLQDTLNANSCYDYPSGQQTASCYANWLNKTYCLNASDSSNNSCNGTGVDGPGTYYLGFDSSGGNSIWILRKDSSNTKYGLNFNPTNNGTNGFYSPTGATCLSSNSGYCRKIIITNSNPSPYDKDSNLSLLKVQSQVWWVDKKCPQAPDFSSASVTCRVELDTYLTNWKNF